MAVVFVIANGKMYLIRMVKELLNDVINAFAGT
jgi:hypothetical protein